MACVVLSNGDVHTRFAFQIYLLYLHKHSLQQQAIINFMVISCKQTSHSSGKLYQAKKKKKCCRFPLGNLIWWRHFGRKINSCPAWGSSAVANWKCCTVVVEVPEGPWEHWSKLAMTDSHMWTQQRCWQLPVFKARATQWPVSKSPFQKECLASRERSYSHLQISRFFKLVSVH